MNETAAAGDLQSLYDALHAQMERAARVQQSLIASEARVSAHDPQQAVQFLADGLEADLLTSEEWARAGMVYMAAGQYAEAEQSLNQAIDLGDVRFRYQSLAARGAARFHLGRIEEGKVDLAAAKEMDPEGAVAYLLGAQAMHDTGDHEAAIAELRVGVKVAPQDLRLSTFLETYLKESSSDSKTSR